MGGSWRVRGQFRTVVSGRKGSVGRGGMVFGVGCGGVGWGVRGFGAVISLLTADPEPVSSPETWIYQECAPEKHWLNSLNQCFCVLVLPNPAFWVGGVGWQVE